MKTNHKQRVWSLAQRWMRLYPEARVEYWPTTSDARFITMRMSVEGSDDRQVATFWVDRLAKMDDDECYLNVSLVLSAVFNSVVRKMSVADREGCPF
jgi:hypothetical protein